MIYRELGRTGLRVSQLGFGAMRLPMLGEGKEARVNDELAIPMIHRAFEAGVNYIDTAVGYGNRDSQRAVGAALKGWREKIVVSTKNPYYGEEEADWWKNLEDSLRLLGVECIDIYNHHGISWKRWTENVEPRVGKWMHEARDRGLIRHVCVSFHDDNEALRKIVETHYPASITLQYNMLDRKLEDGIAYAREKGVGVVVMGPVGGGRLGVDSDVLESALPNIDRVPELALRFVLSNPNVTVALSGMSTMQQVEEDGRPVLHRLRVLPAVPRGGGHPEDLRSLQPRSRVRPVGVRAGGLRPAGPWMGQGQQGRRLHGVRRVRGEVPPGHPHPPAAQGGPRGAERRVKQQRIRRRPVGPDRALSPDRGGV